MANLRDTEDGINEAGWEAEMSRGACDRCGDEAPLIDYCGTLDPADTECLCSHCYQKRTGTGAYDPDNRDWDRERDEQDGF